MSERKVLNKYYPPDFDPNNIPKLRQEKNRQWNIRIMAPFNMRCSTCGEYIYKGKKFNSRKEDVEDDDYLGLKIFRFYIKCPRCVAEISFKTDPQNTDYSLEGGATRNFEASKTAEMLAKREIEEKEAEEKNNPMKVLENRTKASRQEMEMLETLEDLKQLNSRHADIDHTQILKAHAVYEEKLQELQEQQDEAFIKSLFGKDGVKTVKRLHDEDEDDEEGTKKVGKVTGEPPPKKQSTSSRATDILTEDSSREKPVMKSGATNNAWGKSIGSLGSSKSKLGGLVKKKTSTSAQSSSTVTSSSAGAPSSSHNGAASSATTLSSKQTVSSESVKSGDKSEKSVPLGLGLLGAYSDSDDNSD